MKKFIVPLFAIAILVLFGFSISIFQLEITQPIDMINSWGADTTYHQQTEALAHGHLSLGPSIQGLLHDAAFFNGVQLSFGIGPALLRLPIEALAAALGFERVPDKLIFYFYFCVLFYLLFRVLKTHLHFDGPQALSVASLAMCLPIISQLVGVRFAGYEEAVAYLFLGGIAAIICLLWYQYSKKMIALAAFVFASSSLILFRATGALYAVALILSFLLFNWQTIQRKYVEAGPKILNRPPPKQQNNPFNLLPTKESLILPGIFLLATIPFAIVLTLNQIKFGSPLEFGHKVITSGEPINDYLLKFSNTFKATQLWPAIKELWGSIFLSPTFNDFNFYMPNLHVLQAKTLRFREFYFQTFSLTDFFVFLTSALILIDSKQTSFARFFSLSSCLSFALLFAFYLYTPGITSRYVADFSLSFTLSVLAIMCSLAPRLKSSYFCGVSILLWITFGQDMFMNNSPLDSVSNKQSKSWVPTEKTFSFESHQPAKELEEDQSAPPLKDYRCHDPYRLYRKGIANNGVGWNRKSCRVPQVLALYFDYQRCISLAFSLDSKPSLMKIAPRVKFFDLPANLESSEDKQESIHYKFCLSSENFEKLHSHQRGPVFMAFTDDMSLKQKPKVELIEVSMEDN